MVPPSSLPATNALDQSTASWAEKLNAGRFNLSVAPHLGPGSSPVIWTYIDDLSWISFSLIESPWFISWIGSSHLVFCWNLEGKSIITWENTGFLDIPLQWSDDTESGRDVIRRYTQADQCQHPTRPKPLFASSKLLVLLIWSPTLYLFPYNHSSPGTLPQPQISSRNDTTISFVRLERVERKCDLD